MSEYGDKTVHVYVTPTVAIGRHILKRGRSNSAAATRT